MSTNVQISLEARRITLNLKPFAPDGQLVFTVIINLTSVSPLDIEEHSLSMMGGNCCRYSLTRGIPTGDGEYAYKLVMDFSVYHNPGENQTLYFQNTGIRDFTVTTAVHSVAMLGSFAMFIHIVSKGNLTRASYWSLRKALPYPIVE